MSRSTTSSPSPEGAENLESFCYHELVKAGGRPAVPIKFLSRSSRDREADIERIRPWQSNADPGSQESGISTVFSTQLEDWASSFRQKWQWDNRGSIAGETGFSAFLESHKSRYLHKGELDLVSDPSFEETIRRKWENEPRFLELSGDRELPSYEEAVKKRLATHNFTQSFQLKDPRHQDEWTTWVEYLNFQYWGLNRHISSAKASEAQYYKAWKDFQSFHASSYSNTTAASLPQQLATMQAELEAARQKIDQFFRGTEAYRQAEEKVRQQKLRAQWVLDQIHLIESEASQRQGRTKDNSKANALKKASKKREQNDDEDTEAQHQPKRRRQKKNHGSSVAYSGPERLKTESTVMAAEGMATSYVWVTPRRSQRPVSNLATPEAMLAKPRAGVRSMRPSSHEWKTRLRERK